jgi:hypothetical protein
MPDETNDLESTEPRGTTTPTTPTTTPTNKLLTPDDTETESKDAPYQGRRFTGGYVPT